MKRKPKILGSILLAALVLTAAAAVSVNLFADSMVKARVESAAAKALNVEVSVDDADLSITGGRLVLHNLSIGNPPAYRRGRLLVLRHTEIGVDVKSLLSDMVKIRKIRIDDVDVAVEQHGASNNNLHEVLQALSDRTKEIQGKRLRIDTLEISDITVKVDLVSDAGRDEPVTLKLSPIRMTDLGGDSQLDTSDLLREILFAIAASVVEEGIGVLPTDIIGTMTSTLNKTIDLGTRILEGKEDIGRKIAEGLKRLLTPREEE
jgi:hypothetical protein